ncbi:hypothetical protein LCM00_01920 [Bacillus infantis]|uniref:hypothetical protein n=1 Tax=Bacillus infantis TaxID=324767 RepID=UPI001CD4B4CF|nr:hypothetical protein [Bacillus infantis]MCA1038253.1 hypothetical protein [Bacillus infantis]
MNFKGTSIKAVYNKLKLYMMLKNLNELPPEPVSAEGKLRIPPDHQTLTYGTLRNLKGMCRGFCLIIIFLNEKVKIMNKKICPKCQTAEKQLKHSIICKCGSRLRAKN